MLILSVYFVSLVAAQECIRAKPTIEISPDYQEGKRYEEITSTVTVTNNDNAACGPSRFYVSGASADSELYADSPPNFNEPRAAISAGDSSSYTLKTRISAYAEEGKTYRTGVTVKNAELDYYTSPNYQAYAKVYVKPEQVTCTDFDGGINYEVWGRTGTTCGGTEGAGCMEDRCETGKVLTEYYCEGNDIASESYECPNWCGGSGICHPFTVFPDVAVIKVELSNPNPQVGEDVTITVTITNYGNGVGHYPFMLDYGDGSEKFINGEFPKDGQKPTKTLPGAGIGPGQVHTDSYQHRYNKPGKFTIQAKIAAYLDTNSNNDILTKIIYICEDTDDSKNYYVKGKTSGPELVTERFTSKEDSCTIEDGRLAEYYCSSGQVASESFDCPFGCENGACLRFYEEEEELIEVLKIVEGEEEIESSKKCPEKTCKTISEECLGKNKLVAEECKIYIKSFDNLCKEITTTNSKILIDACAQEEKPSEKICQGCLIDVDTCIPFGIRLGRGGIAYYCDITKKMTEQKEDRQSCQNSYECGSNNCKDSICSPICSGCFDKENKCLPYGTRVKTTFCNIDGEFMEQKDGEQSCSNNYECSSNLCIDNRCISSSTWQKFISWLTNLFG